MQVKKKRKHFAIAVVMGKDAKELRDNPVAIITCLNINPSSLRKVILGMERVLGTGYLVGKNDRRY
jgi:hypothetical protein